jgi:hypothetical protein
MKYDYEGRWDDPWPRWYKRIGEPILTTGIDFWYSYVVLPQPKVGK